MRNLHGLKIIVLYLSQGMEDLAVAWTNHQAKFNSLKNFSILCFDLLENTILENVL